MNRHFPTSIALPVLSRARGTYGLDRWILAFLFAVCALSTTAFAETNPWHIVPPGKAAVRLPQPPVLARVEGRDTSGKTWQVTGNMTGSLPVAEREFDAAFVRQGWQLDKVISLGNNAHKLYLWRKGQNGILLMLSEEGVAKSSFAFGIDSDSREKLTRK